MCDKNNKHSGIERGGDNFAMIADALLKLLEQVKLREDAKEILTQFAVGVDLNSVARAYGNQCQSGLQIYCISD